MPGPDPAPDRRKVALVTTTIHVPRGVEGFLENAKRHGHGEQVSLIVVGDRKTPAECGAFLNDLARRTGIPIEYLDVPAQHVMLRRWPALDLVLRYNCIQRRNVGYLRAALNQAEVIVSIDDDNFVRDPATDYVGAHLVVGREVDAPVVAHASGWWNVCERLRCDPARSFYHRGYPKARQDWKRGGERVARGRVRAAVNAGLWLKDPDVDATANSEEPLNVVAVEKVAGDERCALGPGTWCPFNSQNTAFDARLLPAMYLVVMLDYLRGYRVGRLDDIWMSYFVRAIGDQLGERVLYGPPVVVQDRNPHNFTRDLAEELGGYILTEKIVEYLRAFKCVERTWSGAYLELIYHLRECSERDAALETPEREYFRLMAVGMAAWQGAIADIRGEK